MAFFDNIITRTLLPLLFLIKNGNGVVIFNHTRAHTPEETTHHDEINDSTGNEIFFFTGVITTLANMVGCLMIITMTFNTRKEHKQKKFSPSQKFPFYMSMMDLLIALVIMLNLIYMHRHKSLNSGGILFCEAMGFSMSIFITMNMMLMTVIAIITYLNVCKRYTVDLGSFDWILILSVLIPGLSIGILTAAFHGYGQDNYWCYMNRMDQRASKISLVIFLSFIYTVIIITSLCYLKVIKRIHDVESKLVSKSYNPYRPQSFFMIASNQSQSISRQRMERMSSNIEKASRRISIYIILQLIQYVPTIIYCLCFLFDDNHVWIYILFVVSTNLVSIAKSFVFSRNEIFYNQRNYFTHSICSKLESKSSTYNTISRHSFASSTKSLISLTYPPKSHLTTIEEDDVIGSCDFNFDKFSYENESLIMTPLPSLSPKTMFRFQ